MGVIRFAGFGGEWPIRDPRGIPDNAAVSATNIRVDGGAYLKGANGYERIKGVGSAQMVYRIPVNSPNEELSASYWMQFTDINTDVVRGPTVNDSFRRFYWASPSTGLRFAPKAQILSGSAGLGVGVPAPTAAIATITPVVGTGEIDPETAENVAPRHTRSYIITYVNEFGEEGQPGPPAEMTGHSDQTWLIEGIPNPVAGDYATITEKRIYRTVTGLSGVATFYKVADIPANQTWYSDNLSDQIVSAQGELFTTIFATPPDMDGIVAMPNGIFVGWKDNNLYFSENYRPHAWPAEYMITVDYPIVGLGVYGNTCVVCTEGHPSVVSGVKAAAMSMTKIDAPLPCLSRRSIVSAPEGVYYASQDGLVRIGPAGSGIVTGDLISRDQWREDYGPTTIRAMMSNGVYFAARNSVGNASDGFSLLPTNPASRGVSEFDIPLGIVNMGVEPWAGKPWFIGSDGDLYEWEKPGAAPLSYTWRSKEFQYPKPHNFAVHQAYFDSSDGGFLHLKVWVTLRGNQGAKSRVLVYDEDLTFSGREVRFPSGFKSDIWEFEFTGNRELQSYAIASTVGELRGV